MTAELSRIALALSRLLADSSVKRIKVDALFAHAQGIDPSLVGDPGGPARFRDALEELAAAGLLAFPAAGSKTAWDRRSTPAIPHWVTRTATRRVPRTRPAPRVWPHALEGAARIATRADERELLERIARWLRDTPAPTRVPVQERSAELLGDEKALDRHLKTRLFLSGALTLDLLACYHPPLPFASQHVPGTGHTRLLVVENLATYTSFLTALRELPPTERPDVHVGWGHGGEFNRSVHGVPLLVPEPTALYYFGDFDLAGLRVAVSATAEAEAIGLPPLRPASACYEFLLLGRAEWARPDGSNPGSRSDHHDLLRWLTPPLRSRAERMLENQERIPQERLGLEALRRHGSPLTAFGSGTGVYCA